ncbi:hypothetical protein F5148DRAFT_1290889 [Russula earlei]|uniref:Uncharacterized protein n=1 Tax=Russula earlei TaxID=71964 RepID=A0ACC0TW90_9AGAM|nr:hypothetical protein F5148DRAFT_1290889 [Russula earlei]
MTVPPSRALTIQRAYRDRKAKYVADLEVRCRRAEEENEHLRKELDVLRSGSAVASSNSELVNRVDIFEPARLCFDLMQDLERTQKALSTFQQRALGAPPQDPQRNLVMPSATELDIAAILTHTLRRDPSAPESHQARPENAYQSTGTSFNVDAGNEDSECCGGLLDCDGLID